MNKPHTHDAILVLQCQLGDSLAWDTLVAEWHPRMWRFVRGMLGDRSSAEDVLQNIWLRVVRSLILLRAPDKLSGWMYGIARAAVADRLREQYRSPVTHALMEAQDEDDGPQTIEIKDSLRMGLAQLHPGDREVVVLFYLEERSLDEVAEICDIPSGTVKSRLHRARRVIRETLKDEQHEHDQ